MSDDVYSSEHLEGDLSLRFIHIVIENTLGIVNRITSLMRRKRYFIKDFSLSFDEQGRAHVIFSIDGRDFDIQQVMRQMRKIHDVIDVYDTTDDFEKLYHAIYVRTDSKEKLDELPNEPIRIFEEEGQIIGTFVIPIRESQPLLDYLDAHEYKYQRRLVSLV